jgi:malate dehydrogenase (oxaloacetate-decarboxylating)(NADP+)
MLPLAEVQDDAERVVGMHVMLVEGKVFIFADTTLNVNPDSRALADIALQAAKVARHFNLDPRVAMLSFSSFGDNDTPATRTVREAVRILNTEHPELAVDGEMRGDDALMEARCAGRVPDAKFDGRANVMVFPDLQSANIAYKLIGNIGQAEVIGPLLVGLKQPVNMISYESSVDEIVNMAALSSYEVGRT